MKKMGIVVCVIFLAACSDVAFHSLEVKEKQIQDDDHFSRGETPDTQALGGQVFERKISIDSDFPQKIVAENLVGVPLKPMIQQKNKITVEAGYIYVQGEFLQR